jgi:hypothetical protein
MSSNVIEQIVADLRHSAAALYPEHMELKNVRVVGHTPKPQFYVYDVVVDFSDGSERVAAKVYRAGREGAESARMKAKNESANLSHVYKIFQKKKLSGVPRPLGEFTELGAVVAEKFTGIPLQSIIMKAALLPGFDDHGGLALAARKTGEWLRSFHRATSDMPSPFNADGLLADLEKLCGHCKNEGLEDGDVRTIMNGARSILGRNRKSLGCSAVLNDFTPLNVIVGDNGIGMCDYAHMATRGTSFIDVAMFLAAVEALEKYPFCNRRITTAIQANFIDAYGCTASEQAVLRVLKMKALLGMFAQGRNTTVKESALRKKVMWATVMKRFIQQAAQRSLAPVDVRSVA